MTRSRPSINKFVAVALFAFGVAAAQAADKAPAKTEGDRSSHLQMHLQMAKAHQEAADCLTSKKTEEECHNQFNENRSAMGDGATCGEGHCDGSHCSEGMHHKGKKK